MIEIPDHLTLGNGVAVPFLDLGVYRSGHEETVKAISAASVTQAADIGTTTHSRPIED